MNEPLYDSPDERYSYASPLIDHIRGSNFELQHGRVTLKVARKFGFCWGVDRAVALVWDAIRDYPDRRIWLLNQIIHNPKVNEDFRARGVSFVFGRYAEPGGLEQIRREDVVVIPAFSAEVEHMERLRDIGCELVDTTCPWVEKPHRRVRRYLDEGYTILVHGLLRHDETRATCSLVRAKSGHFVVVRDLEETDLVCATIRGGLEGRALVERLGPACSDGFDPDQHLRKVGIINQTTMLASESREVANRVGQAIRERDGDPKTASFRDFDTICPATQDNQDAVIQLSSDTPDVFLVLGGYDSSNTRNLLRAARSRAGSYHIQTATCVEPVVLRHRDPASGAELVESGWLPPGNVQVALSAGASTPDTELAEVIRRVFAAADCPLPEPVDSSAGA